MSKDSLQSRTTPPIHLDSSKLSRIQNGSSVASPVVEVAA